jgi:hypothetical protein
MQAARYDVLVHGFSASAGVHPAAALQLALKLDPSTARMLSAHFPCVVLSAIPQDHAERAKADLAKYGAQVELRVTRLGLRTSDHRDSAPTGSSPQARTGGSYELGEILAPMRPSNSNGHPAEQRVVSARPIEIAGTVGGGPGRITKTATGVSQRLTFGSLSADEPPMQLAVELPRRGPSLPRGRMVVGELPKPAPVPSRRLRLFNWTVRGLGSLGPLLLHSLLFLVITLLTLAAVSWAMRPSPRAGDGLSPFGNGSILGD